MIRKFGSRRASTAARMRLQRGVQVHHLLAVEVAAALGVELVLDVEPARPASSSSWTVRATFMGSPKPVSASTIAGRSVIRAICPARVATSVSVVRPMSGRPRSLAQHGAGDVDPVEALFLDEPRRERVERAGELRMQSPEARSSRNRSRFSSPGWYSSTASEEALRGARRRSITPGGRRCSAGPARRRPGRAGAAAARNARSPRRPPGRRRGCGTC